MGNPMQLQHLRKCTAAHRGVHNRLLSVSAGDNLILGGLLAPMVWKELKKLGYDSGVYEMHFLGAFRKRPNCSRALTKIPHWAWRPAELKTTQIPRSVRQDFLCKVAFQRTAYMQEYSITTPKGLPKSSQSLGAAVEPKA